MIRPIWTAVTLVLLFCNVSMQFTGPGASSFDDLIQLLNVDRGQVIQVKEFVSNLMQMPTNYGEVNRLKSELFYHLRSVKSELASFGFQSNQELIKERTTLLNQINCMSDQVYELVDKCYFSESSTRINSQTTIETMRRDNSNPLEPSMPYELPHFKRDGVYNDALIRGPLGPSGTIKGYNERSNEAFIGGPLGPSGTIKGYKEESEDRLLGESIGGYNGRYHDSNKHGRTVYKKSVGAASPFAL